jgi:hypothetical protein
MRPRENRPARGARRAIILTKTTMDRSGDEPERSAFRHAKERGRRENARRKYP